MNVQQFLTADDRWDAVCARDSAADGAFLFAVRTTGVYCRPHCAARRPLRQNVDFFDRATEAEAAGYRACKRCVPNGVPEAAQITLVDAACRAIEDAEQLPTLRELAAGAGRSPAHFQRLFKRIVGVSPREYGVAKRAERLRAGLATQPSVTTAIHNAGFSSASRAYDAAPQTLGMSPGAYRDRGRGIRVMYTIVQSALGWIGLAATDRGVAAIELADDADAVRACFLARFANADLVENDPALRANVEVVLAYLKRPRAGLHLPLDVQGTAFQQRVWRALTDIAPGQRATYSDVARTIGAPKAARAVAMACAANPVALVIPCHRVIRSDGTLGGYRCGENRKRVLLEEEAAN
jgi:AraC family transcriptional regulator, regulatory protein of adaptative response / methylated-DNA-[protein]-cysteine methyltransferase